MTTKARRREVALHSLVCADRWREWAERYGEKGNLRMATVCHKLAKEYKLRWWRLTHMEGGG